MIAMFRYLTGILEKEEQRGWKILVVLNLISPVMDIFNFSAIIYIINIVVREQKAPDIVIIFTLFMGIMTIIKGLFELYKCKVQNQFLYDGTQKLSMKLCELLTKEDLLDHNQKSPMQAVTLVRSDAQNCMSIIIVSIGIWINILTMAGYYAVMIYVSGWVGAVSCIFFTFFMIGMFLYHHKQMKIYGEKSRRYAIKANAQITIAYGNFKEMKISDNSAMVLRKYQNASRGYAQEQKEYQYKISIIAMVMQNFVMTAVFVGLSVLLLYPAGNISLLFASMVMYFTMLVKIIPMASSIVNGLNNLEFFRKSYEEIKEKLVEYEEIKRKDEASEKTRQKEVTFKRGLTVRNLNFSYT